MLVLRLYIRPYIYTPYMIQLSCMQHTSCKGIKLKFWETINSYTVLITVRYSNLHLNPTLHIDFDVRLIPVVASTGLAASNTPTGTREQHRAYRFTVLIIISRCGGLGWVLLLARGPEPGVRSRRDVHWLASGVTSSSPRERGRTHNTIVYYCKY